jgi:hypothetical protein
MLRAFTGNLTHPVGGGTMRLFVETRWRPGVHDKETTHDVHPAHADASAEFRLSGPVAQMSPGKQLI